MNFLHDQSLKAIEITDMGERCSERHFHQYQKVRLTINFSDSFIFFKQRKRMCIHFQDVNKPRVWLILGNKPQRKASHKIFFPSCWQNKMPVTVWRGGGKEFCLIPRPYHHFPDVTEKGLDKMWNSPPVSPSATQYLLVSFLHNKTEHHLWEC